MPERHDELLDVDEPQPREVYLARMEQPRDRRLAREAFGQAGIARLGIRRADEPGKEGVARERRVVARIAARRSGPSDVRVLRIACHVGEDRFAEEPPARVDDYVRRAEGAGEARGGGEKIEPGVEGPERGEPRVLRAPNIMSCP